MVFRHSLTSDSLSPLLLTLSLCEQKKWHLCDEFRVRNITLVDH